MQVFKSLLGIVAAITIGFLIFLIAPTGQTLGSAAPAVSAPLPARFAAAGPCGDTSKRYFDCGNGTVTDSLTGLIWLKDPNCLGSATWPEAKKAVAALKDGMCMLKDRSAAGDWRLPTDMEWGETMAKAKGMNCSYPTLTDDAGTGCIKGGQTSFTGVESDYYWTSVPQEGGGRVFMGDLDHGNILNTDANNPQRVWPVRGGKK